MTQTVNSPRKKRRGPTHYLGNPKLKAANVQISFTQEQFQEYFRCSDDPVYFIKTYMKIVNIDKGLVPFEMWPFQETMVDTFNHNRFTICKLPRQTGKSTTVVGYFLWMILFRPQQSIAILANRGDLARALLEKIKFAYEYLPIWIQQGILSWNKGSIELENGSKIVATATSSSAARGGSYNAILLDEFAFVQPNMQEQFFNSVYPTISSGKSSKVIIVSTPNGMGNLFYKMWMDATDKEGARNSYVPIEINWWDVPGRDEAWKKQTIENTSQRQFAQEFECQFLGSMDTLIDPNILRAMVFQRPVHEKDNLEIIVPPEKGHIYAIVCDTSRGIGLDYSAFVVMDITQVPYLTVAKYRDNDVSPLLYPSIIYNTGKVYNNAHVMIEINDNGQQVADILHNDLEYDNIVWVAKDAKAGQVVGNGFGRQGVTLQKGVKTSKQVKRLGCTLLKNLVENHKLIVNDIDIIGELSTFVLDKDTYAAEEGCNDDLAMSLVLFAWMINQDYFKNITNTVLRTTLYEKQMQDIEQTMTPFGIVSDGVNDTKLPVGYGADSWLVGEDDDSLWLAKG
jgi:hypothetical protein